MTAEEALKLANELEVNQELEKLDKLRQFVASEIERNAKKGYKYCDVDLDASALDTQGRNGTLRTKQVVEELRALGYDASESDYNEDISIRWG